MKETYQDLKNHLAAMKGVVVAFSGGVDSSLLAKAAFDALGDKALAVSGVSLTYASQERELAKQTANQIGIKHQMTDTCEMELEAFRANNKDRCYHCKNTLFETLKEIAKKEGLDQVVEGSNADDTSDFRPGIKAAHDLGVRSPFIELGITKKQIREMAKEMGLSVWDKPASACLSSRIPYGEEITSERLSCIEAAESVLKGFGLRQLRARDHGNLLRIEVAAEEMNRFYDENFQKQVVKAMKDIGYTHISLDLQGYRTGSMNE